MNLTKDKTYMKSVEKKLVNKHKIKEYKKLLRIEEFLIEEDNLKTASLNHIWNMYGFEQLKGNDSNKFTAKLNSKIRVVIIPKYNEPYNYIETVNLKMVEIDDHHYKEG